MKSDPVQAYVAARRAKELADRDLARAEGALTQALAHLQEQTGLESVQDVWIMLAREKRQLVRLEKAWQRALQSFQQQQGQRLEES